MRSKTIALLTLITLSVFAASFLLHKNRFFPFSTGTPDKAFLECTFGMSPQEITRCLKRKNAMLMEFSAYKHLETTVLNDMPFNEDGGAQPIYAEDKKSKTNYSLYMPSIEVFGGICQAQFDFKDNRLVYVRAFFRASPLSKSEELVNTIQAHLEKTYALDRIEKSDQVPGAYTIHFNDSAVKPSLWVNMNDENDPIIIFGVTHIETAQAETTRVENRENSVF